MKKYIYRSFLIILLVGASVSLFGQSKDDAENIIILNYKMGLTTGNSNDFVSPFSFRGFELEYRRFIKEDISVGIDIGYQNFYDDLGNQNIITDRGLNLYGSQFNWFYSVPILFTGHYYWKNMCDKLMPYAGLGFGAYYNDLETTIGGLNFETDGWQFGLAPEIGTFIFISDQIQANLAFRYDHGFESDKFENLAYFSCKIGLILGF